MFYINIMNKNRKKQANFQELCFWNQKSMQYGSAIRIPKKHLQRILFVIAALPLCTAWIFPLLPFVEDFVYRY